MQNLRDICLYVIFRNLSSQFLLNVQWFHCCIHCVKAILEFCILLIQFIHIQSHISNYDTIHNRTTNQYEHWSEYLLFCPWTHFSNTKQVKRDIEWLDIWTDPVCIIKVIYLRCSVPDELNIRYPLFIAFYCIIPKASKYMDVHEHHENQVHYL